MEEKKVSPEDIFVAVLDTFNDAMFVIDNEDNLIMNIEAQKLNDNGLNLQEQSKKIKVGSSALISYKNQKYRISKKDINHGTNSCICTLSLEDDTIARLQKSSLKLKKVLSSI
jgi:hypothetical protein